MTAEDLRSWTPDFFLSNESDCRRILCDSEKRKSVPSLNALPLHAFKDKQLVRFRGMIQDTYNPEYYLDSFQVRNTETNEITTCRGKFRDTFESAGDETQILDSENNCNAERQTCFVISVPCLNTWAKEKHTNSEEKVSKSFNNGIKRALDSQQMDCEESSNKKSALNVSKQTDVRPSLLSKEHVMNFPLPNEGGKACIVKIYEETSFRLNQVIDIVGFISLDPALSLAHDSEDAMDDIEFQSHNPPASLIPRLHAIDIKDASREEISGLSNGLSNPENVRADLKLVLSQILFGDTLAAEYVICHLISSVYLRRDLLSLGSFPLNVTNFSLEKCPTFTEDFYSIFSSLLPKTHLLGITLDDLNNLNLVPKKDYDCNRLTSGILQLSDNTHLVLDETKLTSGQVSPNGRRNYDAISTLINHQKVTYDFKFYTMEFQTDIPILILSETKSMIPCDRQVLLEKSPESEALYTEILEATRQYLRDEARISNIRNYLKISRHREIEIENKISDVIQEDFVKMRQSDKSTTAEDLHSLMVLARLLSLSHSRDKLTVEDWNEAVRMEIERKARLPTRGK